MLEREYKEVVTLLQNLHNASSKASPTIGKLIDIYIETHVKLNALYKSNFIRSDFAKWAYGKFY